MPLVQFHFRSDYEFRFLRALLPAGARTIQPFVPAEQAPAVFAELLESSRRSGLVPMWCCFKQHRADPFLLSCQVDGFSLELNYPVTSRSAKKLTAFFTEIRDLVIAARGRLYLAKDDVLDADTYARSMGRDRIERFLAIKRAYDPEGLFQSGLFRRIFAQDSGE
jgi:FAD/FMN-containing dehydrogenase